MRARAVTRRQAAVPRAAWAGADGVGGVGGMGAAGAGGVGAGGGGTAGSEDCWSVTIDPLDAGNAVATIADGALQLEVGPGVLPNDYDLPYNRASLAVYRTALAGDFSLTAHIDAFAYGGGGDVKIGAWGKRRHLHGGRPDRERFWRDERARPQR